MDVDVFEGPGRVALYRLGSGLLDEVESKVAKNMPEWIVKEGLSWVYSKDYPWLFKTRL